MSTEPDAEPDRERESDLSVPTPPREQNADPERPGGHRTYSRPPSQYVHDHHDPADFGVETWQALPTCPREFAAHYDVYAGLLPFRFLEHNRLAAFLDAAEWLHDLRPTKATFRISEMADHCGVSPTRLYMSDDLLTFLTYHGSYPLDPDAPRTRYVNPEYVHGHPPGGLLGPDEPIKRVLWLHRYAATGVIPMTTVADRFDTTPSGLRSFAAAYGVSYRQARTAGRRTMARTAQTIMAWAGCSPDVVARLFGVSAGLVRGAVSDHRMDLVPPDPSGLYQYTAEQVDWASYDYTPPHQQS